MTPRCLAFHPGARARCAARRGRLLRPLLAMIFGLLASHAAAVDVHELIRHVDRLWRGDTSQASMTMTVKTVRYQRAMTLEAWSLGKTRSLVVIREPVKDRGIATLKVDDNIWNYLPKIDRVIKVPASMMSGSWMGSHFTNDDLVKESTFEDDYDATLSFEGARAGRQVYELTFVPRPDAAVVWGKVVMEMQQDNLAPIAAAYYDEAGTLMRTMRFDELRQIGERVIPMRLTLQPEDKPDESTVIRYRDIAFDVSVGESFFSLQSLKARH